MSEQPVSPPEEYKALLQTLSLELSASASAQGPLIQTISGGRNNRLWRLETQHGPVILKAYYPDTRPRLETEWHFLQHAQKLGLDTVPRPLSCNKIAKLALYTWIGGEAFTTASLTKAHFQHYLAFLKALNPPGQNPLDFPPASDSCFSLADHHASLSKRIQSLQAAPLTSAQAAIILDSELLPLWQTLAHDLADWANLKTPFDPGELWLSPSDVGFHNALLSSDDQVVFVDFEYAGRDHRFKTLADLLTSVGVPLPLEALKWVEADLLAQGTQREERLLLRHLLPLHQLKWCCILMGLFSPAALPRRDFARGLSESQQETQIARIRAALNRTRHWQKLAHELAQEV